jgi:hypothetical protein
MVHVTLHKDLQLSKVESQDMRGFRSDKCCHFLTTLDIVLTVVELAKGEEQADQPQSHPGNLLEGAGGGYEKSHISGFP